MQTLKRGLAGVAVLLGLAMALLVWQVQHPPSLAAFEDLQGLPSVSGAPSPVRVTWAGVTTLLVDDGDTALLTDGFFSRPGMMASLVGVVEPDTDAIIRGLARLGVPGRTGRLAAVMPVHSHYDHAMDAPEVARRTGALLVGSPSTLNVGRGADLPESQLRPVALGVPQRYGRFTVTWLASRHAPTGFTGGEISTPLRPPARAFAYREGQSYALWIRHESGRSLLINGSAGFEPGALDGVKAEVVLLGIGALGQRDPDDQSAYWQGVVQAVGAQRVLPVHWDNLWKPAEPPLEPMPVPVDRVDVSLAFLKARAAEDHVDLRLPLPWVPFDPWAGLAPGR